MAARQIITKIKFYSINRDIKAAVEKDSYSAKKIAKTHHVSPETVRSIRRVRTWPAFVTAKQLKSTYKAQAKADAFANNPEKVLAKELKKLADAPVEYITIKQFTDAIDSLNGKIKQGSLRADTHRHDIERNAQDIKVISRVINRIQQLKPRWFREG